MVTTGAITNRVDRLEERGYVERVADADRRKVNIRLTAAGLALVDDVVSSHLATEAQVLACLTPGQRDHLARLLRVVLLDLGDAAPG